MNLTQPLHKALQEKPDTVALVYAQRRQTFAMFVQRVARLAAVLRSLGVANGERLAMLGQNSDLYVEYLYATWWAGGVVNPVNVRWSAREIAYSLDDCDTLILLVDDSFLDVIPALRTLSSSLTSVLSVGERNAPADLLATQALAAAIALIADARRSGTDLAAIMYTGGTTGHPKGVMLTHENLYLSQLSTNLAAPRPANAIGLNLAPMFHVGGMGLTLQLMMRLCQQIIVPAFDEKAVLATIERERASETFVVPTMLKRLIDHPCFDQYDVSSLELVLYGAAPIDETLLATAQARLPHAKFCQLYGMTELSPVITVLPPWCHEPTQPAARRRSAGYPVTIAEVRIIDPDGVPVPPGTIGEIVARGPMVMAGYWNLPERTAEALRYGWLHTGDGGYMDADGFVYVVHRLKDMIGTGGGNVYSAEVENAIAQLPQVSMCAVIGIPDDEWGERVHAMIVLRLDAALVDTGVVAHCRNLIARYKCPRSVEFVDEMPLSPSGKLLKYQLRAAYWAGRARGVN